MENKTVAVVVPLEVRYTDARTQETKGLVLDTTNKQLLDSATRRPWNGVAAIRQPRPALSSLPVTVDDFVSMARANEAVLRQAISSSGEPEATVERQLRENEKLRARLEAMRAARTANAAENDSIPLDVLEAKVKEAQDELKAVQNESLVIKTVELEKEEERLETLVHEKQLQNIALKKDTARVINDASFASIQSASESLTGPLEKSIKGLEADIAKQKQALAYLDELESRTKTLRSEVLEDQGLRDYALAKTGYVAPASRPTIPDLDLRATAANDYDFEASRWGAIEKRKIELNELFQQGGEEPLNDASIEIVYTTIASQAPGAPIRWLNDGVRATVSVTEKAGLAYIVSRSANLPAPILFIPLLAETINEEDLMYQTDLLAIRSRVPNQNPSTNDKTFVAENVQVLRNTLQETFSDLEINVTLDRVIMAGVPPIREFNREAFLQEKFFQFLSVEDVLPENLHRRAEVVVIDATVFRRRGWWQKPPREWLDLLARFFQRTFQREVIVCTGSPVETVLPINRTPVRYNNSAVAEVPRTPLRF